MKKIRNMNELEAVKNSIELRKFQLEKEMRNNVTELRNRVQRPFRFSSQAFNIVQQVASSSLVKTLVTGVGKKIFQRLVK